MPTPLLGLEYHATALTGRGARTAAEPANQVGSNSYTPARLRSRALVRQKFGTVDQRHDDDRSCARPCAANWQCLGRLDLALRRPGAHRRPGTPASSPTTIAIPNWQRCRAREFRSPPGVERSPSVARLADCNPP